MNPQAVPPKPPLPPNPGITSTVSEDELLKPMDIGKLRSRIYDHAFEAVKSLPPVQNSRYKLALENPRWIDPDNVSPAAQKKAFFQGGTLSRRIAGDWVMTDIATNQPVSRKTATVAAVPHLSDRGLFLLNGSHWHLGTQTRLDPGVYPRRQENGEISAYINPKGGRPHHISLDPAKGLFYFEIGSSRLPLTPILQALGANPDQMREAWGHDILARNSEKKDTAAIAKLFKKLYEDKKPTLGSDERKMVAEKLQSWGLDPYVTERTIGKGQANYSAEVLLDTTKKLLAISRKEADPVERDDQAFQHILGQEHLFAERIKNSKPLLNQLLWKMTAKGNLDNLPSGALNQHLLETITGTGLGINAQMTNPAEMLDAVYRVSKMGQGAIGSLDAVPDDSRDVQGTQFGFIDPAVTPESGKIGVDLRYGSGTARSKDGRIYSKFHDVAGKPLWLSPREVRGKTIAAWEQRDNGEPFVEALKDGKFSLVPRKEVNLWTQPTEYAFSPVTNLIPFKSASPLHRTAMGTRMTTQALPLIGGESPLVASGHPDGGSFESKYGTHFGAVRASQPGRVMAVTPEAIKVKYQDGTIGDISLRVHELYDHAPGRKTHFTQRPAVKPGDFFDQDHLLATSNYTDNSGRVALGLNARVAWLPARGGKSFEDAFAVSQSFADRMKSDHMAVHGVEEAGVEFGKNKFKSLFASKYDPKVFENLDDNGVVKPGTKVQPGQPLILAVKKMDAPRTTLVRSPKPIHQDASEIWDHDYPGEVVDVIKTKGGYRVSVKSEVPMQFGDKISGRHGNKGIITIIPDHEMPVGEDGKPFEIIASPYTLASRKNDSQIAEVVLGKIAQKLGKPYEVPDFKLPDLMQFVREEAAKHKVSPTETVFDPVTGTKIPGVLAGTQYFMKLMHVVEGKIKQRDTGGYDAFDTPAKGGSTGAKRMALADSFALIAHGANSFLKGSKNVRGQRNENWWEATMSGYTPAMPGETVQYQRFMSSLQASGIHPVQENGKIRLKALTDEQVQHFAGDREIQNPKGLDWSKEGDPFPGGLFDKKIFGENFNLWGKMKLHKPMPNPAFEDPIRYTLGLTEKQMRNVIAGKAGFVEGKFYDPETAKEPGTRPRGFTTGPEAIQAKLKSIDLDKEIEAAHAAIAGNRKTHRDTAIRKLKYLQGAKDQGVHPSQWMWSNVPILPPRFRPVSRLQGSNTELVSDPNYLYQDLFNANKNLQQLDGKLEDLSDEHLAVYDSLKAVTGLGDPINPKTEQKGVKGLLRLLLAESPKWSIPQHKLLSSPVDLVGRSTIAPDSSLDMDEIGIPEDMAFTTYSRFAIQRLVKSGMSPVEASRAIENKSTEARQAVLKEMETRPLSYHRAPVLHQFGHIGAWPKLIKGNVIKLSPFVYKGLGGDNDGDKQNAHVFLRIKTEHIQKLDPTVASAVIPATMLLSLFSEDSMPFHNTDLLSVTDHSLLLVDLSEFPHGELSHKSSGQFGEIEWFNPVFGTEVLSYDERSGALVWAKVSNWTRHQGCPLQIVELKSGRQIFTDDDPRAVYGVLPTTLKFSRFTPKQAAELKVLVPRMSRLDGVQNTKTVTELQTRDLVASATSQGNHLIDNFSLNAEFGYLIGCAAGNGWSASTGGKYRDWCFAGVNENVQAQVNKIVTSLFEHKAPAGTEVRRSGDCSNKEGFGESKRVTYTSVELSALMLNFVGSGARNKHLPNWFLFAPRECRQSMFAGLMDTDGSVGSSMSGGRKKPQVVANYTTASFRLAREVTLLAASLGIRGRVSATKTPAGEPFWIVGFSFGDIKKWNGAGLFHQDKLRKIVEAEAPSDVKGSAAASDLIPVSTQLLKALGKGFKQPRDKSKWIDGLSTIISAISDAKKSGYLTRPTAQKILQKIDPIALEEAAKSPDWTLWKSIVDNTGVTWEPVVSYQATDVVEVGYDLSVPGFETFVSAEGIVLSNTVNIHVPVYQEEIDDITQKMMPSKNLLSVKDFAPHYKPEREFHVGLWQATSPDPEDKSTRKRVFHSLKDLKAAFQKGEVSVKDRVVLLKDE